MADRRIADNNVTKHFLMNTLKRALPGLITAIGIAVIILLSFVLNRPPAVVPADAPANVFSAERAAVHLPFIASEPNPIGSKANEAVRNYIVNHLENLGLEVHVQKTSYYYAPAQRAATLHNVLTRIPGTGGGKAILFMGHYDTLIMAPGASDNGSAVITMLELVRMLLHNPPLNNDLIFFFPDGEEYGLLGARAFMREHPWVSDIEIVINFEAMGTSGQSIMFETGENNFKTVKEYARAVPFPTGNSLSMEIYKMMPTTTDFEVFKTRGFQGLNFAYIGSSYDYHTAGDNIENTSLRSIQHHGEHAAALALHFGNLDPNFDSDRDAVYFNTIGYGFAYYPYNAVSPIAIIIALIILGILITAFIKKKIKLLHVLFAGIAFLFKLVIIYLGTNSLYHIIESYYANNDLKLLQYNQNGILAGFLFLVAAFSVVYIQLLVKGVKISQMVGIYLILMVLLIWGGQFTWQIAVLALAIPLHMFFAHRKPIDGHSLASGAIVIWTLIMLTVSFTVTGASYLFKWPLLIGVLPFLLLLLIRKLREDSIRMSLLLVMCAIPLLLWFPYLMYLFQLAMGLSFIGFNMIVAGLMMGLLIPHVFIIYRINKWILPSVLGMAGVILIVTFATGLDYNERHRKQNRIIHATDGNSGQSFWLSFDDRPDKWTVQFIGESPGNIALAPFYPYHTGVARGNIAPGFDPVPPTVEVIADTISHGERKLSLQIVANTDAYFVDFYFLTESAGTLDLGLGQAARSRLRPLRNSDWMRFMYLAPPDEGIILHLYTEPGEDIHIHLNELNYSGIPENIEYIKRPAHMMNAGDLTLISHSFVF